MTYGDLLCVVFDGLMSDGVLVNGGFVLSGYGFRPTSFLALELLSGG